MDNSTYSFEVILEMFQSITSGNLGAEQGHLMHVSDQCHCCSTSYPTSSSQQERATRCSEDTVNTSHVVKDLAEYQNIQLTVLSFY